MLIVDDKWLSAAEQHARNAVLNAGIAAMGYYRAAFNPAGAFGAGSNPSTEADIQATIAGLRSLGGAFHDLDPDYQVYGEELDMKHSHTAVGVRMSEEITRLSNANNVVRTGQAFIDGLREERTSVILDAIDGTTNFRAGLPIFCSAIAVFVKGKLQVGAIYDPIHHVVFYGSLRTSGKRAFIWHVSSGENTPLKKPKGDGAFLVATHLTRSNPDKRLQIINKLNQIVSQSDGHYQLNSGQLQLAYVAAGNLSAFANNSTNSWDVAAGQVLVEAIGGVVTQFNGSDIDYTHDDKIEVVAGSTAHYHEEMIKLVK